MQTPNTRFQPIAPHEPVRLSDRGEEAAERNEGPTRCLQRRSERDTPDDTMEGRRVAIGVVLLAACQANDRPPSAAPPAAPSASTTASPPSAAGVAVSRGVDRESGKARAAASLGDGGTIADAGRLAQGDAGRGPVLSARRTISALRPDFRACYTAGLKADPAMVGAVFETVTINADGSVASAVPSQVEGLGAEVVACFGRVLTTARFPPPGMDGSTLKLPIEFRKGTATLSNVGDLPPYIEPGAKP